MTYYIPYKITHIAGVKRPLGIPPKGYVKIKAKSEHMALKQARKILKTTHIIYNNGIVRY